jgi:hypothetical protein
MQPEEISGRSPEQKKADIAAQHEKARTKMAEIAKMYQDTGSPLPFKVPAPNTATVKDIKDFLTKAGKSTDYSSWNELSSILDRLRGEVNMWALDIGPDPFAGSGNAVASSDAIKHNAAEELQLTKAAEDGAVVPGYRAKYQQFLGLDAGEKIKFQQNDPEFAARLKAGPPTQDDIIADRLQEAKKSQEDKKQEILKMHERARVILKDIADMFKDAGQESPINVPSADIAGTQILEALKLANMGAPLTGWSDLMKRLNNLKGQVASHLSVGTPSPFAGTAKPAPASGEIVRREGDNLAASIPTPTAGGGTRTVDTGTKGPPKAPLLK